MPLTPALPSPLPAKSKALVKAGTFTVTGESTIYDYVSQSSAVSEVQWRLLAVTWSRATPAGTTEDRAQFGFNIVKIDLGQIVQAWQTADYVAAETACNLFFGSVLPLIGSSHTCTGFRWYLKAFNPDLPIGSDADSTTGDPPKPWHRFARSGPPLRVTTLSNPGTAVGTALPYQDSLSVTLKTPAPKHWGRIYIPGITSGQMDPSLAGRLATSVTTTAANATAKFITDLAASKLYVIVPHTQQEGKFATGFSLATIVQVDDVPDVIRRRRAKQARLRTIGAG